MALSKNDLEEINDPAIIERYLTLTHNLHEKISCYFKSSDNFFNAECDSANTKNRKLVLDIRKSELNPEKFRTEFISCIDRTISLSFKAQDTIFFARTKVNSVAADKITLDLPVLLYKLQRRANLRLRILGKFPAHCVIPGVFEQAQNIFDISAGGFSILLPIGGGEKLPVGMPIPSLDFLFRDLQAKISVEVRSHTEAETSMGKFLKVGFRFIKLPPTLEQKIVQEAVSHNQKILAKRIK